VSDHAPLVSVIKPTHNGAGFVGETIESVLAQTYQPIELVVVDDASEDGTPEIVASYGERNPGASTSSADSSASVPADDGTRRSRSPAGR
jgi:glycosyltransferase involved in cell wall biosynthesis